MKYYSLKDIKLISDPSQKQKDEQFILRMYHGQVLPCKVRQIKHGYKPTKTTKREG